MGIFERFKKKHKVAEKDSLSIVLNDTNLTGSKIQPEQYQQYSNESITANGHYDLTRLSAHEKQTIRNVLMESNSKYTELYRGIGLANEAYGVLYKPRYILHEIIILKYSDCDNPLDRLAVALAYETKGAQYREQAILFFEDSINRVNRNDLNLFAAFQPLFLYNKLSVLYEKEHRFDEALKSAEMAIKELDFDAPYYYLRVGDILKKCDINQCVEYFSELKRTHVYELCKDQLDAKEDEALKLQAKDYIFRPRKKKAKTQEETEWSDELRMAALEFVGYLE